MTGSKPWPDAHGLVERDAELATLRELAEQARSGRGMSALVVGPPGIGKTALLLALQDECAAAGWQVVSARAGELEQEFPYGVMRQLYEAPLRAADEHARAALLAGPARPAGALVGGEYADGPGDGAALDHAFYWLALNLAERGPLLVAVDDLHWADAASVRSLIYLERRLAELPVLLLAGTRPVDGPRRVYLERLAADASQSLQPGALSASGVESLVQRKFANADDAFCSACHTASGGNPFLVTELIGAISASGVAPVAANAGRVQTVGAQSVMRSVLLRLAGLPAEATTVARGLAVLGECRRLAIVSQLSGIDAGQAAAAIAELRTAHIVAAEEPLRFVHSIVHAAVYEDLQPEQRSELHARAARLLADAGEPSDAVAGHLLLTSPGADPWTFQQLVAGATSGLALSAPETAAAYLDRALHETVAGVDRVPLLLGLGAARFQTPGGGAVEPLREALRLASDPGLRMQIVRALGSAYMTELRYDDCWALVDATIEELGEYPEFAADLEIYAAQSTYSDLEANVDQLPRIRSWHPDPSGAEIRDRSMLATQAWVGLLHPDDSASVLANARAALSSGTLVDDDVWYVSYEMAIWALIGCASYDEAIAHLDADIASRRAIGRLVRAASLMLLRAEVHRRAGRLQLAEEDARIAVDIIPPEHIYAPQTASTLVLTLIDRGELARARGVLAAHGFEQRIPDGGVNDILWFSRGRLRIAEGDVEAGLEDVLRYGDICEKLHRRSAGYYPWRSVAADALVRLGRNAQALELAHDELLLAEQAGVPALGGPALVASGIATTGEAGIALLERAVAVLEASPMALDAVHAQLALGRTLRVNGKRERAREPLRLALDAATRMGAKPLAEQAQAELIAAGARPRRQAVSGVDALTPSELRVATLAAQGLTNRDIAHTLYVTPKTIEAHLAGAYRKLGVSGKAELAAHFPR